MGSRQQAAGSTCAKKEKAAFTRGRVDIYSSARLPTSSVVNPASAQPDFARKGLPRRRAGMTTVGVAANHRFADVYLIAVQMRGSAFSWRLLEIASLSLMK